MTTAIVDLVDRPSGPAGFLRRLRLWLAGATVLLGCCLWLSVEQPELSVVLFIIVAFSAICAAAPLRIPALILFSLALISNSVKELPADGKWMSPLSDLGRLIYENLNNVTGIGPLRFAGIEVLFALFLAAVVVRRALGQTLGDSGIRRPLGVNEFLILSLGMLIWLWGLGIATDGDFKASLWQIRELLWFPILVWLFQSAEVGPRDFPILGGLILVAAVLKTLEGAYFRLVICADLGIRPQYVTTHSDTELFVTATLICGVAWFLMRTRSRWLVLSFALIPLVGIVLNNRRLAFVSLAADAALIFVALPRSRLKRSVLRAGIYALPAVALYTAIGWNSDSPVFAPAHSFSTMLSKTDASALTRDIENYNLIHTLKEHPLRGWGFGHEYLELSKAYDISHAFALYRYIGHNSVLWLWELGGLFGFALLWLPLVLAVFFSARTFFAAEAPRLQAAALVGLTIPVTHMMQAYGDMGLLSWNGVFLVAVTLASMSRTAVALGAWPGAKPEPPRELPGHAVERIAQPR